MFRVEAKPNKYHLSLNNKIELLGSYKRIVQYSLFSGDFSNLNVIKGEQLEQAKEYARYIDQPRILFWLNQHKPTEEPKKPSSKIKEFTPPESNDPLVNSSLVALAHEFYHYLEYNKKVGIHILENHVFFEYFTELDFRELFHNFLKEKYDDEALIKRESLIKETFRLRSYYDPIKIRDRIISENIPLEIYEQIVTFGDDAREYCLFCGRRGKWEIAREGYVEFSQQRPQSHTRTKQLSICPVCIFASLVSMVRTCEGGGTTKSNLIALKTTYRDAPATYIYNRILGLTTGNLVTIQSLARGGKAFGGTLLTYLSASCLPEHALIQKDFRVFDLSTNRPLDKKKLLAIKAFEPIIGLDAFWRSRENQNYRKAHYEILKNDYYGVFGYLADLFSKYWRKKELLERGIYKLLKNGVIEMNEEPEIVFGTALLIDSFMPEQWQKEEEELKTEARKVAFYLERPEEVLLRLRQMSGKDYTTIKEDFRNKASFMLLRKLLNRIHKEEGYDDFDSEQEARRKFVEERMRRSFGSGNFLFLGFDDLLKVYLYIQKLIRKTYGPDPKRIEKKYSDFISRIKYALIARRPELAESGD